MSCFKVGLLFLNIEQSFSMEYVKGFARKASVNVSFYSQLVIIGRSESVPETITSWPEIH